MTARATLPPDRHPPPPLLLGSASPRRQRILRDLGLTFSCLSPDTEEEHDPRDPVGTVTRNALAKHAACRALRPDAILLTADTLSSVSCAVIRPALSLDKCERRETVHPLEDPGKMERVAEAECDRRLLASTAR